MMESTKEARSGGGEKDDEGRNDEGRVKREGHTLWLLGQLELLYKYIQDCNC
jgi:hypothetical protein